MGHETERIARFWEGESVSWNMDSLSNSQGNDFDITEFPPRIDRFDLDKVIGRGGFGVVFLATEENTHRQVALKILNRTDPELREKFFREAILLSELKHPSIVTSSDFGQVEGKPYYVMEFIEGSSLAKLIQTVRQLSIKRNGSPLQVLVEDTKSRLAPKSYLEFVIEMASTIADALHFIHRNGVVHRDIKPGNILIDLQGRAKLSDFGLAGSLRNEEARILVGTYPYMSPEQLRGEDPDPQSDIFSFGVTIYEALTLQRPFTGNDRDEIAHSIFHLDPISPRKIDPLIPKEIDAIVTRCLEKDRATRYGSAGEIVQDLKNYLDGQTPPMPQPPVPRRKTAMPWTWVALAVIGGGALIWNWTRPADTNPVAQNNLNTDVPDSKAPPSPRISEVVEPEKAEKVIEPLRSPSFAPIKTPDPETSKANEPTKIAPLVPTEAEKKPVDWRWKAWPHSDKRLDAIFEFDEAQVQRVLDSGAAFVGQLAMSRSSSKAQADQVFSLFRGRESGMAFGSYLSAFACLKSSRLAYYPSETIPYESLPAEAFLAAYPADGTQVTVNIFNYGKQMLDLLSREIQERQRPYVVLGNVTDPSQNPALKQAGWTWKLIADYLGALRRRLNPVGIRTIGSMNVTPYSLTEAEVQWIDESLDGMVVRGPLHPLYCRPNLNAVFQELRVIRYWLDQKKLIVFEPQPASGVSGAQERKFLAGVLLLLRKDGDACFITRKLGETEDWFSWSERLGNASSAAEQIPGSQILQRRFKNGLVRVDFGKSLAQAEFLK